MIDEIQKKFGVTEQAAREISEIELALTMLVLHLASISNTISSTGKVLADLWAVWGKTAGPEDRVVVEDLIRQENIRRDAALQRQLDLFHELLALKKRETELFLSGEVLLKARGNKHILH